MAAFTLAHLSDPHLPPLPAPRLSELASKRVLGYLNWTRNRHKFQRRDVLDVLVSDLQAQTPDHIAVTGDLVNLALEAEFAFRVPGSKVSARRIGSRSSPAITTPMFAQPSTALPRHGAAISPAIKSPIRARHFRPCAAAAPSF